MSSCLGKIGSYPSEAVALKVKRRLNELIKSGCMRWEGGPIQDVYECRCGEWHLSKMSRERQIAVELSQVRAPKPPRRQLRAQVRIGGRP